MVERFLVIQVPRAMRKRINTMGLWIVGMAFSRASGRAVEMAERVYRRDIEIACSRPATQLRDNAQRQHRCTEVPSGDNPKSKRPLRRACGNPAATLVEGRSIHVSIPLNVVLY
jgi:hypothetical protein